MEAIVPLEISTKVVSPAGHSGQSNPPCAILKRALDLIFLFRMMDWATGSHCGHSLAQCLLKSDGINESLLINEANNLERGQDAGSWYLPPSDRGGGLTKILRFFRYESSIIEHTPLLAGTAGT